MELPPEIEEKIVAEATAALAKALITNHGKKAYLTRYQVCGILDCSPQTVMDCLSHYDVTGKGGSVRFLLSDVEEYMDSKKVKVR